MSNTSIEVGMELAKATPPTGILGAALAGVTLPQLILWVSAFCVCVQAFFLIKDKVIPYIKELYERHR
jgi:hypothetical protein